MTLHTKLTAAETLAILDLAHAPDELVEIVPGHSVPVGGASAAEWIAFVVRPNASVRQTFTLGASEELALAQGIERPERFDLQALLNENIDSGPEVKACMGAVFLRHPGDPAVQASFMRMPASVQARILKVGGRKTWGSDPAGFFGEVGRELAGLDAVIADSLETDGPTKPKRGKAKPSA